MVLATRLLPSPSGPRNPARLGLLLVVFLSLAAACGELTPPEAYIASTSTTVAASSEDESQTTSEESTAAAAQQDEPFAPTADPGYVPTLLVAANRPIYAVDGLDSIPLSGALAGLQGVRVYDDLGGGLVIQENDGAIVYRQAQGQTDTLLESSDAVLLGVGFWDGSPRAFVQSTPSRVDWIRVVSETPGEYERRTHFELGEGERIVAFSASLNVQAVVVQDEDCGELRFYGADGQRLSLREPPPPACTFPGRPSFGSVALSPDGGAVAYTIVTYRDDGTEQVTELAALELLTGVGIASHRVGENLDTVSSLTYDGKRAAYIRASGGDETVAVLDLTDRSSWFVNLLGATDIHAVAFTRLPLEIGP